MKCIVAGRVLRKRGNVSDLQGQEKTSAESDKVGIPETPRRSRRLSNGTAEVSVIETLSVDIVKSASPVIEGSVPFFSIKLSIMLVSIFLKC